MVHKHKETVFFNSFIEWLKAEKRISFKVISEKIHLKRSDFDQIRILRRRIKESEWKIFKESYKEEIKEFEAQKEEKETPSDIITVQKELIEAQKKIISSKESDIEAQTKLYFEMNERLLSEIKALTKKLKDKGVID